MKFRERRRTPVSGMIEWGGGGNQNQKKSLGLPPQPKTKSLDQNLTLKKSHAEFPSHKNFQKGVNDISKTKGNFSDDKTKAGR